MSLGITPLSAVLSLNLADIMPIKYWQNAIIITFFNGPPPDGAGNCKA
jgi:hypothetical protein